MLKKLQGDEKNKKPFKIAWDEESMTTGFPEIDAQHKKWIAMFNDFENAINQKKGKEVCAETLLFFIRYAETHFQFEEDLMETYHCTARYLNKQEHDQFRVMIQEVTYKTWPLGATDEDVLTLEEELVTWLKKHICNVDVKLREWVL